ncbi:MAG TPA: DNA recombination protein RmuC [Opitutaceae bacterium]|jgi:DNA recombination protein RmuC|nr:DNA recombination protein RmuC [Opitutaceae bacterium]
MTLFLVALVAAVLAGLIVWLALGKKSAGEKSRLETLLAAERDAHTRLSNEFKALSAEALKSNNESFLKLAQATLEKFQEGAKGDLASRQQAIDSLVKPLRESLEKVDGKISEIEKARATAYGQLSEQLKTLGTAQIQLQAEATKISTALSGTRTAGTWGELQLRRVVEMADMLPYCDFTEQQSAGALRADLVVRLPGGQRIVVDAKAPNDAYREAANAPDEAGRVAKLAEHAAKVRGHIDALGAKNYWEQFQPSPEFVVLFLPGDQFLSGALQADPTLIDRGISKKVLLATPATLIALLKAAAYGWRQESVSKNAEEIARIGRELFDRISTFGEHLENVGTGLKSALSNYNKAVGSYEGTLLPGARKFVELGAKGAKDLPTPAPVEIAPREVAKRG